MRPYEVAVIFDATLDETVVRETTDKIGEFVKSRGGQPGHVDRWGRRQFAYEMNHKTEGNYVFIEIDRRASRCRRARPYALALR